MTATNCSSIDWLLGNPAIKARLLAGRPHPRIWMRRFNEHPDVVVTQTTVRFFGGRRWGIAPRIAEVTVAHIDARTAAEILEVLHLVKFGPRIGLRRVRLWNRARLSRHDVITALTSSRTDSIVRLSMPAYLRG